MCFFLDESLEFWPEHDASKDLLVRCCSFLGSTTSVLTMDVCVVTVGLVDLRADARRFRGVRLRLATTVKRGAPTLAAGAWRGCS